MQPEKIIQDTIINYLRVLENQGAVCATRTATFNGLIDVPRFDGRGGGRRVKVSMHTGRDGWPDITAVIHGFFVGIEVKTDTGRQSADQRKVQAAITSAGGQYFVVRSLDEMHKIIQDLADEKVRNDYLLRKIKAGEVVAF